jgi:hypothetical protein
MSNMDRRRTYTKDSSDLYYEKMVKMRLGYAGLEEAKRIALNMTQAWQDSFGNFYAKLHDNRYVTRMAETLASGGMKGKAIRYVNYVMENLLLTGRVSYGAVKSKLMKNGISEVGSVYLIASTACASTTIPTVTQFYSEYNPTLLQGLKELCPRIGNSFDEFMASGVASDFETLFTTYPTPNLPRSTAYYYVTGRVAVTSAQEGTAGGKYEHPAGVASVTVDEGQAVNRLNSILNNLKRLSGE